MTHPTHEQGQPSISRARVVELNEIAAAWFTHQLGPDSPGRRYLEHRIGADVVDHGPWRLGYAPPGWTHLVDHLRHVRGVSEQEILTAGLGRHSSRGTLIDVFRDRAMIAVRDEHGATMGFVGRDLSGQDSAPKYLNTANTPAYTKGEHLLGVYEAAPGARPVRVEGPLDAIAVTAASDGAAAGYAPLGTALTLTQARILAARGGGRVWEALDGDRAGLRATERDYWMFRDLDVDTRSIPMPPAVDPAKLWRQHPATLRALLSSADHAPTAGLAVIDALAIDLGDQLDSDDIAALEEWAATQDLVASRLPTQHERASVRSYAAEVLDDLRARNTARTAKEEHLATARAALDRASDELGHAAWELEQALQESAAPEAREVERDHALTR